MLLLSPQTWVQHLVLIVPALYVIVARGRGVRALGTPGRLAVATYVLLVLVLNREVAGRDAYLVLLAYHVHTIALLIVLAVVVLLRPTQTSNGRATDEQRRPSSLERSAVAP